MTIHPNGVAAIDGDSHHNPWVRDEGLVHDLFTAQILRKLIAMYNVKVCVDAGANIGTLTRVMLDAGCHVHAFEPNLEAVECLRRNCPEAVVYECGLANMGYKASFMKCQNAGASYAFSPEQENGVIGTPVQMQRLDIFTIKPGLIKLDVEGFETFAILGAQDIIRKYRPVIVAEVNSAALTRAGSSKEALGAILSDYGYDFEIMQPDCTWESPQFDIIALPR